MTLASILIVWWFAAGAFGAGYFEFVDGLLTSILGHIVLIGSLAALWYHMLNSIRHLIWDTGRMMQVETSKRQLRRVRGYGGCDHRHPAGCVRENHEL